MSPHPIHVSDPDKMSGWRDSVSSLNAVAREFGLSRAEMDAISWSTVLDLYFVIGLRTSRHGVRDRMSRFARRHRWGLEGALFALAGYLAGWLVRLLFG